MASLAPSSQSTSKGSDPPQMPGMQMCDVPPRIVRTEMTITISKPQKRLLEINEVAEEFYRKLQDHNVQIDTRSLHTDMMIVTQGDPLIARQCLASVICTESVKLASQLMPRATQVLQGLCEKYPSQFSKEISRAGTAEIAFLPLIKAEVEPVLADLNCTEKVVPLTSYFLNFFEHRLQKFATKFNSKLNPPVDLRIVFIDGQPHLHLKCQHDRLPQVVRVLEDNLTLLCFRQLEVDTCRSNYLQSSAGKEKVQNIEKDHPCTVQASTQYEKVLVKATSPRGHHQVRICEGNMAATECPVMVVPVWNGQKPQSSYTCILQRGCLNTDLSYYLTYVGSQNPKPLTRAYDCRDMSSGQTVIIMYVPPVSEHGFQEMVSAGLTEALRFASTSRSGLALPLKLRADFSDSVIHQMLTAVCDYYTNEHVPQAVHFYHDIGQELPGDIGTFFQEKKWTTEMFPDSMNKIFDQRVETVIGDILNAKGDALVNSTDRMLEHKNGQVSSILLTHLGESLTQQCKQHYPGGIGDHIVAITDALEHFKYIFNIVMPQQSWKDCHASRLLQSLRTRVEACLNLASVKGLSSIVFPAIATGNLGYPPHLEARAVLETTNQFFRDMPYSSLKKVTFVTYRKNPAVAKVFKAVETVYRYSLHQTADRKKVERRFQVKTVLVQVIKGDATTHRCTAQLLICADPPATGTLQNYLKQKGPACTESLVDKRRVRDEVQDLLKKTTVESVQLNMQTFDAGHVDSIVTGIAKANMKTVQIIVIVVSSSDVFRHLCSKLESSRSYVAVDEQTDARILGKPFGLVGFCGSVSDTSEAVKKVLQLEIPDLYVQAEKLNLHPSFLATSPAPPPPPAPPASAPSQQEQAETISVPRDHLQEVPVKEMIDMFNDLNISVSFSAGQIKFRGADRNLRECVQNTLIKLMPLAQHTAPVGAYAPTRAPAVPMSSPTVRAGSLSFGDGAALSTSAIIKSAGSLNISSIMTLQPNSSNDFDKNISNEGRGNDSDKGAAAARAAGGVGGSKGGYERRFRTQKGLEVWVYTGDITVAQVDAIVSAAHERLTNLGGVAAAIAKAAGPDLQKESNEYVDEHGPLKVTDVVVTTAGLLQCQKVLHALGPRWDEYTDKQLCQKHLTDTIYNCLEKANQQGFTSLAVCSVSSGIYHVPENVCAESYLEAVLNFEDRHGERTGLHSIHFVDINSNIVNIIQKTFATRWG